MRRETGSLLAAGLIVLGSITGLSGCGGSSSSSGGYNLGFLAEAAQYLAAAFPALVDELDDDYRDDGDLDTDGMGDGDVDADWLATSLLAVLIEFAGDANGYQFELAYMLGEDGPVNFNLAAGQPATLALQGEAEAPCGGALGSVRVLWRTVTTYEGDGAGGVDNVEEISALITIYFDGCIAANEALVWDGRITFAADQVAGGGTITGNVRVSDPMGYFDVGDGDFFDVTINISGTEMDVNGTFSFSGPGGSAVLDAGDVNFTMEPIP